MTTKDSTNAVNVCCMKITISSETCDTRVGDVIYYRGNISVLFIEKWKWFVEYLAARVKVANPRRTVWVYIGPQNVLVGKEWHEYRRASLLKSSQRRLKNLDECVYDDDLFHFKSQEIEQKKDAERSKIEALERDEFQFPEFPEYINKIKKYL